MSGGTKAGFLKFCNFWRKVAFFVDGYYFCYPFLLMYKNGSKCPIFIGAGNKSTPIKETSNSFVIQVLQGLFNLECLLLSIFKVCFRVFTSSMKIHQCTQGHFTCEQCRNQMEVITKNKQLFVSSFFLFRIVQNVGNPSQEELMDMKEFWENMINKICL